MKSIGAVMLQAPAVPVPPSVGRAGPSSEEEPERIRQPSGPRALVVPPALVDPQPQPVRPEPLRAQGGREGRRVLEDPPALLRRSGLGGAAADGHTLGPAVMALRIAKQLS